MAADSPLRRLPPQLERKQVLFLDGIRHAAELAELGYARLVQTVTQLALGHREGRTEGSYTEPFLYAWSVVDAIDRLRGLLHLLPSAQKIPRSSFRDNTQVIRDLRNVADHLAQRADYVVARSSTALGVLSWFTLLDDSHGLACSIVPGTIGTGMASLPNPVGKTITPPSDLITLAAGEHTGSLSDAMKETRRVVSDIEASLGSWLRENDFEGKQAGADMLAVVTIKFAEVESTHRATPRDGSP